MHIISLGGGGITFLWEILRAVDMSFDFIKSTEKTVTLKCSIAQLTTKISGWKEVYIVWWFQWFTKIYIVSLIWTNVILGTQNFCL